MELNISLKAHGIDPNGVIHVGANTGEMAPYYHSQGVNKVMWIDKDHMKYKELYQTSSPFAMDQLYFTADLCNINEVGGKTTFKSLWRKHSAMIDIETYDLLCLDIKSDTSLVLDGFEDFIKFIQYVLIRPGAESWAEKSLADAGFLKTTQTGEVIIYKGTA
jgi:hypothetical protein